MTPAAWMEADRIGVACNLPEDYYSEFELSELRYPVLSQQLAWMDWIDTTLASRVDAIREYSLRPSRLWFYCLKRLVDPLLVTDFILRAMFDRLRPSTVWIPSPGPRDPAWERFFRVGPHGRMEVPDVDWSAASSLIAAAAGIQTRVLPASVSDAQAGTGAVRTSGLRAMVRRHTPGWALDAWAMVRLQGWRAGRPAVGRWSPRLLVIRSGYDLDLLVNEAIGYGCRVDFWSGKEASAQLNQAQEVLCAQARRACAEIWPEFDAAAAFRTPFDRAGFDAYALARPGLAYYVTQAVPSMIRYYLTGRDVIRRGQYRAVLAPAAVRAGALLASARDEGVPVVVYQHGGFVATCEHLMWDFADLAHADRLIVYGDGEKDYFEGRRRRYSEPTAGISVAGSARLEAQRAALDPQRLQQVRRRLEPDASRRVVVYVSTVTSGYSRLIAAESYPETQCFERQVRVFELMRQYPSVTFIFKPYSDRDTAKVREMLARRGVDNCRIVADIPLLEVMQASDAIAVEFPSTALLEAATSGKPFAAYIDRASLRLDPAAAASLREGALVAETHAEFFEAIRCLAEDRAPSHVSRSAGRFAREYSLDPTKGPAARRAFDALAEVADLRPRLT